MNLADKGKHLAALHFTDGLGCFSQNASIPFYQLIRLPVCLRKVQTDRQTDSPAYLLVTSSTNI